MTVGPIVIAGGQHGPTISASLAAACARAGISCLRIPDCTAWAGGPLQSVAWRLAKRPLRIAAHSRMVEESCRASGARILLTTGACPILAENLHNLGRMGVIRINWSTDDPWNVGAGWFLTALRAYDLLLTPRHANEEQLRACCTQVAYLPFGFDQDLFFPDPDPAADAPEASPGLVFVGGGDADRAAFLAPVAAAGMHLDLYGGFWERQRGMRRFARGLLEAPAIRRVTRAARANVCLVRRANRDGHVMRSLEIPACGGVMLAEDTREHRDLLGPDGEAVHYFTGPQGLIDKARLVTDDAAERRRLRRRAHALAVGGGHTYDHRLASILAHAARLEARVA